MAYQQSKSRGRVGQIDGGYSVSVGSLELEDFRSVFVISLVREKNGPVGQKQGIKKQRGIEHNRQKQHSLDHILEDILFLNAPTLRKCQPERILQSECAADPAIPITSSPTAPLCYAQP